RHPILPLLPSPTLFRSTPPAPQRRDGIAAGATAAPARDSSPAVALAPAPVAPATRNPAPSAARTRNDPPASTRTPPRTTPGPTRSEEHTSELQSRENLV